MGDKYQLWCCISRASTRSGLQSHDAAGTRYALLLVFGHCFLQIFAIVVEEPNERLGSGGSGGSSGPGIQLCSS